MVSERGYAGTSGRPWESARFMEPHRPNDPYVGSCHPKTKRCPVLQGGGGRSPPGRIEPNMETVRRYNYRAYPTRGQREALSRLFGACRYAWNWYLDQRKVAWWLHLPIPSYAELSRRFTEFRKEPENKWLWMVSSGPMAQALRHAETAYSRAYARKAGYPHYKSRHCGEQSATFTRSARFHVRHERNARWMFLKLPKIDGEVRLRWSRDLPSRPSSVTVMLHADGTYEASFVVRTEPKAPPKPRHNACGIDMGLESLASIVYSDGTREKVAPLRALRRAERRLRRLDKELSRRQRGSNNYSKTRLAKARLYARIGAQRRDLAYKLASQGGGREPSRRHGDVVRQRAHAHPDGQKRGRRRMVDVHRSGRRALRPMGPQGRAYRPVVSEQPGLLAMRTERRPEAAQRTRVGMP